jgi:hypothetical protein
MGNVGLNVFAPVFDVRKAFADLLDGETIKVELSTRLDQRVGINCSGCGM